MLRKSRHGLTRCPACSAHIRAAATPILTVCPFCQTNITARVIRRAPAGRGALIAASLFSLSAMGCGGNEQEPPAPVPDQPVDPDDQNNTAFDPNEPDDNTAVSEYGIAPDPDWDQQQRPPYDVPVPEYGAPPPEETRIQPDEPTPQPAYGVAMPPPEPPEG